MREGLVECKECRFWVQYTEEELELRPGLADIGLCHQFRSANWLFRMESDECCGHGEYTVPDVTTDIKRSRR